MIDDELNGLFNQLIESSEREYYGLKGITEKYINNKETDVSKIEHLLDELLDSYMNVEEAKESFFKLCNYLDSIDKESADSYRKFFEDEYSENEDFDDGF